MPLYRATLAYDGSDFEEKTAGFEEKTTGFEDKTQGFGEPVVVAEEDQTLGFGGPIIVAEHAIGGPQFAQRSREAHERRGIVEVGRRGAELRGHLRQRRTA